MNKILYALLFMSLISTAECTRIIDMSKHGDTPWKIPPVFPLPSLPVIGIPDQLPE